MGLRVVSPAVNVLPKDKIRLHLKFDGADGSNPDDALIDGWLAAAVEFAQHYTHRSVGQQTLELALDEFPDGAIELPLGPAQSISAVTYLDTSGAQQTLPPSAYSLDLYSADSWLVPAASGGTWPATFAAANAVKVQYVTGSSSVSPAIAAALLMLIAHLCETRPAVSERSQFEVPLGVAALLGTSARWIV